jgi:phage terminase large subunit-like protein
MTPLAQMNRYQLQEFFPQIKWNKYIPHHPLYPKPNPRQYAFLAYNGREAFYGGQAGGGKTDGLLMGAMQYVEHSTCHGILFRRTFADLHRSGGLIPRAKEWLAPFLVTKEVRWNGSDKMFTWPSGATVEFGYLDSDDDIYRYQGGDWTFAGFDELPQLKLEWYRYIFSRMRTSADSEVPIRVRGSGNPGGPGHEWVKQRFITNPDRVFIRSTLEDNPYLNTDEYDASLRELDPVTYRQLRFGDWNVRPSGGFFSRDKLRIIDRPPVGARPIRMWDLAATKHQSSAYTAGALTSWVGGKLQVWDVVRIKGDPGEVENVILQTAQRDGRGVKVYIEQEPGSGGVNTLYRYKHYVLAGWYVEAYLPKHDKLTRAAPLSAIAAADGLELVSGRWNAAYLDELVAFPDGFKDQVDVTSASYQVHTRKTEINLRSL